MKRVLFLLSVCCFSYVTTIDSYGQPTYNLRFVVVTNDGINYDIKVQISGRTSFGNGGANICFDYNSTNLSNPTLLLAHNFNGGLYSPLKITTPLLSSVSINVEYNGPPGSGDTVSAAPAWTDIASIRFTILNTAGSSNLNFRPTSSITLPTVQYLDDLVTTLQQGTFTPENTSPLPVILDFFNAVPERGMVRLRWKTVIERNLFGFTVQRSCNSGNDFVDLSFIQSAGSGMTERSYQYIDLGPCLSQWIYYRLKILDNDGSVSYSTVLDFNNRSVNTSVLHQPYPNPSTGTVFIRYFLSEKDEIAYMIHDNQGREISTFIAGELEKGLHIQILHQETVPSGTYYFTLMTESGAFTRTMQIRR